LVTIAEAVALETETAKSAATIVDLRRLNFMAMPPVDRKTRLGD
jgi:hypothetical protein